MQIKYLKKTHDSDVGDVKDIPDMQAAVLIVLCIAEAYQEPIEDPTYTLMPENTRLNLNGTPVIDDFGNISTASEVVKPKKNPTKPKKKD